MVPIYYLDSWCSISTIPNAEFLLHGGRKSKPWFRRLFGLIILSYYTLMELLFYYITQFASLFNVYPLSLPAEIQRVD